MPYTSLKNSVGNAVRLAEILQVLVRHGFADLLRRLGVYEGIPAQVLRKLHLIESPSPELSNTGTRLRSALTELGPTFVKVGQLLSTRPDIVGLQISKELSQLQDRVEVLEFSKIRPLIEESLEKPLDEAFLEFNETPIAAASLSQVYRAKLHNGVPVAVKVMRPRTRHVVESDLRIVRGIADWVADHVEEYAWIDARGIVDEFERSIRREMDFSIEARTIERFRANFTKDAGVFIPKVYRKQSSSMVLTMDWIDGVRVDDVGAYEERNSDPKRLAVKGCEVLCKQVFEDRLFHADPHPGNVMLTRNNQIAFLDYGMAGHLEESDVRAIADLLQAVFLEDTQACVQAVTSFTVSGELPKPEALEHEIAEYLAFEAQSIIGGGQVSRAIDTIVRILRRHKLQLASRFSLLLKALATIESTGHALDPDMDMVPVIQPYVERIIRDRFSPVQVSRDLKRDLLRFVRIGRDFPNDLRQIMRMLRRGSFRIQLSHEKLDNLAAVLDQASNRLTVGVVTGSLIVGSSMLVATGTGLRHVGIVGYSIAGLLGIALVISILRSRNY